MKHVVKSKVFRSFVALSLLAVCVACASFSAGTASSGFDIEESAVSRITKNVTTQRQIIDMFGVATSERTVNGKDQYFYEYLEAKGVVLGVAKVRKTLLVMFNDQKVVEDYAYKVD